MSDQKGLTLLEVVISVAILLIVVGAIIQMFVSHMRSRDATSNYLLASEHNQRALQRMAEELRGTDRLFVNVALSGPQGARTLEALTSEGAPINVNLFSTITFRRISGFDMDTASQVWSSDIIFRRDAAKNQVIREQDGNTEVLGSYAADLSFYLNGSGGIGVLLKTSHGRFLGHGPTGAEVENRVEIYPMNAGTD